MFQSYVVELGQKMGAMLLRMEHRYYGESVPFGKQSWDVRRVI